MLSVEYSVKGRAAKDGQDGFSSPKTRGNPHGCSSTLRTIQMENLEELWRFKAKSRCL